MIQNLIDRAKQALAARRQDFQEEEVRLRTEESILQRLRQLEERLAEARRGFDLFKSEFSDFCSGQMDVGEWFAGELPKMAGRGPIVYATLLAQIAANDAAKAHKAEVLTGCRKVWVGGPEADLASFKRENAEVIRIYASLDRAE
jgi:hypothetical protein